MGVEATVTRAPELRFRYHRGWVVAGLVFMLSLLTLVPVSGWFALLLAPPALVAGWLWRAGTDVTPEVLRVRALLGSRSVPWERVTAIRVSGGSWSVVAQLDDGRRVPLTAVTAADLATLATRQQAPPAESREVGSP